MKLIKPFFSIRNIRDLDKATKEIEQAARTCYKSEDKIKKGSDLDLVQFLIKKGHHAMLEFGPSITVLFICDRGVSHELVRHRIASFAQECISGDTEVHKGITIKNLYDRKNNQYGKTHNKTIWLKSVNKNKEIIPNKIKDIFYKGKQDIYEITTRTGYKMKCTLNHEFLTKEGFKKLNELKIGDDIIINGRKNNNIKNLLKLCTLCHRLFHKKWYNETITTTDKIINIKYIGIEDTYDLEMQKPYHNYIANGFVVHNSTRYCNYNNKDHITFIIPPWINVEEREYHNVYGESNSPYPDDIWLCALFEAEKKYKSLINKEWSPQQARSVLPNSLKTEINIKANIREWRHIFKLRCSKAAHPQMRELMIPLYNVFCEHSPILFKDIKF